MQLSGEGGAAKAHKTSFHAIANIARTEGPTALYKGYPPHPSTTHSERRVVGVGKLSVWVLCQEEGSEGVSRVTGASVSAQVAYSVMA